MNPTGIAIAFNATSLLFTALAGIAAAAIAAAIAIPLAVAFGIKKYYYDDADYSYYSGSGSGGYGGGYGGHSSGSSYTEYAKRCVLFLDYVHRLGYMECK